MNVTQIIVCEMQGHSRFEVAELLGKPIRKPSERPHLHPLGEILLLHIGGRNPARVRASNNFPFLQSSQQKGALQTIAMGFGKNALTLTFSPPN